MSFKDYYQIMGLAKNASPDEIKRAYRKLARQYHPDVSQAPDAEEKFKALGEAYDVLKDKEKRKLYDRYGEHWQAAQQGGYTGNEQAYQSHAAGGGANPFAGAEGVDINDIFSSLFGEKKNRSQYGFYDQGQDIHAKLSISLEDSFFGTEKTLQLQKENGELKTVKVKIPKGIQDKQQLRLRGQGGGSSSGKSGDLLIEITIMPHQLYQVEGKNVLLNCPISPWEAVLGGSIKVPTLSGMVSLNLPKHSQSGKKMRLKGKGLPGNPPGDQYVILNIVIPEKENEESHKLYETLKSVSQFNPRVALGVSDDG